MLTVLAAVGLFAIVAAVGAASMIGAARYIEQRHYNSVEARRARIAALELELGVQNRLYALPDVVLPPIEADPEAVRLAVIATRKRRLAVARKARPRHGRDHR